MVICVLFQTGIIGEDEIRLFLNCHFLACRALSKIMSPVGTETKERSQWLVGCLRKYQWLAKFSRGLCERKGVDVQAVFGQELQVCDDMISLLPSKIDRMHFLGESGLTL